MEFVRNTDKYLYQTEIKIVVSRLMIWLMGFAVIFPDY